MTDRLFKFGSIEDEIMKSMETTLVKYQKDQMYGHEKLAKAVDHLNIAAEIFDDTGFTKEAEFITKLIEKIADESNVGGLIEESLPAQSSPINKLLEEELTANQIKDLIQELQEEYKKKTRLGPEEPFQKSPSAMPPAISKGEPFQKSPSAMPPAFENITDEEMENVFKPTTAFKKKVDKYTKGLTPEKMVQNLLNTGTVFDYNADDANYTEDLLNLEFSDDLEISDSESDEDFEDE